MSESSLWFASALLAEGWTQDVRLELKQGRIDTIQTAVKAHPGDSRHEIGLPGLPNVHSHAFQRGMAGLSEVRGPEGDSFWTWRELMYRFVDRLGPDDVEAIAAMAFMEMLETGFTRVGEFHYLHHDRDGRPFANLAEMAERVAAAADATGIGLTLLPVFYAHSGFGGAPPTPAQGRFLNTVDGYQRLLEACRIAVEGLPDARVGRAPHSLRAVTEDEMRLLLEAATGPIHLHIAEQTAEVETCLAWSGSRPVDWLLDRFDVDASWCLVHATHISPDEIRRLAATKAVAGVCPITEANLGDGVFSGKAYLAAGGVFGVGSDSNVRIDAAEELRLFEYSQRLTHRARNVLAGRSGMSTGAELFRRALAGGSAALGETPVQGFEQGQVADIVSLSADHPDMVARRGDAWIDSWLFAGSSPVVEDVWRFGRKVVSQGRHQARQQIVARYRAVLEAVLS
jgi:formimidoylglutamate deiminase